MDSYTVQLGRRRGVRDRSWEGALSAALLSDSERGQIRALPPLRDDAQWQGSIRKVHGGWLLQGHLQLQLQRECSRCLRSFWWSLQVDIDRSIDPAEEGDASLVSVDGNVDVIDLLREEVWLSWQRFVVCDDGCRGFERQASVAGGDEDVDHPFAALSQIKF